MLCWNAFKTCFLEIALWNFTMYDPDEMFLLTVDFLRFVLLFYTSPISEINVSLHKGVM